MLLLAALMAVWTARVGQANSGTNFRIYVDDRAMWARGRNAVNKLKQALEEAEKIDAELGMKMRADKCEIFATHKKLRKQAKQKLAPFVDGKGCVETFSLLGVWYNVTRKHRCHGNPKGYKKARKLLTRLKHATDDFRIKRNLIRSMVLPPVTWMGAWSRAQKNHLLKIRTAVEKTTRKWMGEASPALNWITKIGPDLDPFFQVDQDVIRHLKWMWDQGKQPNGKRWRIREMFKYNCITSKGEGKYETENVTIDLGWDGGKAVRNMLIMAWEKRRIKEDARDSMMALQKKISAIQKVKYIS